MKEAAVKVETVPAAIPATGIYKVVVIAKLARFEVLKKALNDLGVTGMTMTQVMAAVSRRCRRDVSWSGNGCDPAA